jgi:hypothetical protein
VDIEGRISADDGSAMGRLVAQANERPAQATRP